MVKKCVIVIHTEKDFAVMHLLQANAETIVFNSAAEAEAVRLVLDIYGPLIWEGYKDCDVNEASEQE